MTNTERGEAVYDLRDRAKREALVYLWVCADGVQAEYQWLEQGEESNKEMEAGHPLSPLHFAP